MKTTVTVNKNSLKLKQETCISTNMENQIIAKLLISLGCVQLNVKDPFTYASGLKGPIYCDNRLILSSVEEREMIVDFFIALIQQHTPSFDVVCGLATGGIPYASWIADRLKKPLIYVRSQSKGHGKKNLVEGKYHEGQKTILIEDLINQGKSSLNAYDVLNELIGPPLACYSIVDYEMTSATQKFAEKKFSKYSLAGLSEIIRCAKNNFSSNEFNSILDWHKNPQDWNHTLDF